MSATPLDDEVRELLLKPNPAVMATLRKDGSPVSVPTWYRLVGDRILLNLDKDRVRLQHIRRDPRVALSVMETGNWTTHVSIQGRVVEIVDDPDLSGIDSLAQHYIGENYFNRERPRVDAWVEIDHVHVWGRLSKS
ncbi:PPOX class F420-dependent oxidoreductase [Dietzia maris]|uniref:PPOX class F420-dependent oxidoreductase n=1 Tax=Dietzia maris TaxID=37915 RepID=UPI00223B58FD|nr:PPOX class F420-dependent oxidoreductase [Dietzia maris]MCT1433979.1 PPOX class F420-dependent oxidoreductase [Dietzia maris]MCT1521613.1 PPOX class F420-dependent oxidoreductase [Dietzia maris]